MNEQDILELLKRASEGDKKSSDTLRNVTPEQALTYSEATQMKVAHFWNESDENLTEMVKCTPLFLNCSNSKDDSIRYEAKLHLHIMVLNPILGRDLDDDQKKAAYQGIIELAMLGYAPASFMLAKLTEDKYNPQYFTGGDTVILLWYSQAVKQGYSPARDGLARFAKKLGRCTYCGGSFKGFFSKKCKLCKKKTY